MRNPYLNPNLHGLMSTADTVFGCAVSNQSGHPVIAKCIQCLKLREEMIALIEETTGVWNEAHRVRCNVNDMASRRLGEEPNTLTPRCYAPLQAVLGEILAEKLDDNSDPFSDILLGTPESVERNINSMDAICDSFQAKTCRYMEVLRAGKEEGESELRVNMSFLAAMNRINSW